VPLEVYAFIGTLSIRQYAEEWDLSFIEKQSSRRFSFAVGQGLSVTYVTGGHDAEQARGPARAVRKRHRGRREAGSCLCDTVGQRRPRPQALVRFAREVAGPGSGLDWQRPQRSRARRRQRPGRGAAGATRLHGCAAGESASASATRRAISCW